MSEIKQTNFRVSKDAADAFRGFCEEQGINQAQGFDYLLEVLALDKAKSSIQSRETEISNFEQHTKALISAYLHSLELNENAEARIREHFAAKIESQSKTIIEYQTQISTLEKHLEDALDLTESYKTDLQAATDTLINVEKAQAQSVRDYISLKEEKEKQLSDKESIINMLSAKLTEAEKKATEYDALLQRAEALQRDLTAAERQINDNAKDAEIALERAVRAAEKALEVEHRKELDRLRSQNTELLQTVAATERSAAEEIRTIEKESASLREKLALLRKDLEEE